MSIYRTATIRRSITLADAMPWPRWVKRFTPWWLTWIVRRAWWRLSGRMRAQERHTLRRMSRLVVSADIMRAAYDMAVSDGGDVTVLPAVKPIPPPPDSVMK